MNRRTFLRKSLKIVAFSALPFTLNASNMLDSLADPQSLMPTLFIGHGAPLYTLDENPYSLAWRKIAAQIPKPKAIVCISAHWLTKGTQVMAMQNPRTIHDFGRMDDRLFQIQYAAAGNPELAQEIIQKVQKAHIEEDHHWGFDHGTWTVLRWMYPKADIPIIQISLDYKKDLQYHYDLAKELAFLRKQGVLIVGSGNIVHNLRSLKFPENSTYDWAIEFDQISKELIENRNHQALIQYEKLGEAARLSIPTPDHYLPLLYILGLQTEKEKATFPIEGISYGSTSMRSVLIESF